MNKARIPADLETMSKIKPMNCHCSLTYASSVPFFGPTTGIQ